MSRVWQTQMMTYKSHSKPLSLFLPSNTKSEKPGTWFLGLPVMGRRPSDLVFDNEVKMGSALWNFWEIQLSSWWKKQLWGRVYWFCSFFILLLPSIDKILEVQQPLCNHKTISMRTKNQQVVGYNEYKKEWVLDMVIELLIYLKPPTTKVFIKYRINILMLLATVAHVFCYLHLKTFLTGKVMYIVCHFDT